MNNFIIETSDLCKCYGSNMVVSHVNIHVQKEVFTGYWAEMVQVKLL